MPRVRPPGANIGRPKGSLNKNTTLLKEAAGKYTPAALQVLQSIMCNPKHPAAARVAAAAELLNRGHGRPAQALDIDLKAQHQSYVVKVPQPMDRAEFEQYLEFKRSQLEQPKTLDLKPIEAKPTPIAPKPNGNQKPQLN